MKLPNLEVKDWIIIGTIFFAALLAAGLSAYQYYDSVQEDNKNELLQRDLIESQKLALEKAENLEIANKEIRIKANQLIETQAKLNSLQSETMKKIMGNGYAVAHFGMIESNKFKIIVENKSDYPLYESDIVVYDQDLINKCPKVKQNGIDCLMNGCLQSAGISFSAGTLKIKNMLELEYVGSLEKERFFSIVVTTKHNMTIQYSIIKKNSKGSNIIHFYRIYERNSGKYTLLEKDNLNASEEGFKQHFSYKKDIPILFN